MEHELQDEWFCLADNGVCCKEKILPFPKKLEIIMLDKSLALKTNINHDVSCFIAAIICFCYFKKKKL